MKVSTVIKNVTNGTCDITKFYGPQHSYNRHFILQMLSEQPVSKAKCGYNTFRNTLLLKFGIGSACVAVQNQLLKDALLADSLI